MRTQPGSALRFARYRAACLSACLVVWSVSAGALAAETAKDELKKARSANAEHWARGEVKYAGKWISYLGVPNLLDTRSQWSRYEQLRGEAPRTVEAQLKLADWCRQRGMKDQERAHLTAVVDLAPDHPDARNRLDFVRTDGVWTTRTQLEASARRQQVEAEGFARWADRAGDWRKAIDGKPILTRNAALAKIKAIRDVDAVLALEQVVSTAENPDAGLAVIAALAEIDAEEATMSLARHAAFHKSDRVRAAAAETLRSRSMDLFVPKMLAAMYTPVEIQSDITSDASGNFVVSQTFKREGQEQRQEAVVETTVKPGSADRRTSDLARAEAERKEKANLARVKAENERVAHLNDRVCTVLASVSDVNLPAEPQAWWQWWNTRNEVFVGPKPTRQVFTYDESIVIPPVPSLGSFDCLAAGTPVWTARGAVVIERIQVGDMVLAQHPETGELAYKPVLATTVRPASPLAAVRTAGETLRTSGGHPLWVEGRGWIKARNVKSSDQLYGASSGTSVLSVEMEPPAETYNLIVADFHTYFIGDSRILSHDNTVCAPTRNARPGRK